MVKNTAGQKIGAQLVTAADGSAFTGAVTAYVTVDAGTQAVGSVGSGACTHEGNGYHTYAPSQAETNGTLLAFTFTGTGAVPATVQVFTTGFDPTAAQVPANVTQFGGSNGTFSSGVPAVNTTQFAGATVNATTSVTFPASSTVATTTGAVGSVTGAVGSVTGNVGGNVTGSVGSVTGNVGGNVVGSVASVTAGVTVSTNNDKTGYSLSASGIQAIWDALTTALTTASSIGKLLVDNLNATISSRLASAAITLSGGAVTVGTNNDKTGYSIASGGIGSGAHAAAELNAIADAVLDRNMATGTDSGTDSTTTRTPRQALRALRNKTSIAAGTMTVTKEDDSTASWTAAVTTTAGNPVSAVDPT